MTPDEKIQEFIAAGSLKLDKNGKPTGALVPMISVPLTQNQPRKGTFFPDIDAKTDREGNPLIRLFPRSQVKEMALLGWKEYRVAAPPKGVSKSKEKTDTHVDSEE